MGWKGTVRSFGATVRAMERDAKRRQRALESEQKQYDKMQALEQAAYEVDVHENYLEIIQSIHKECSPVVDWSHIALSSRPDEPKPARVKQDQARLTLKKYKPSFIDRLFNREDRKRTLLMKEVEAAAETDEHDYGMQMRSWTQEVKEWEDSVTLAKALLNGEAKAKLEVIDKLRPFTEVSNLGSSLSITVYDSGLLESTINVHGTSIVPSESKSLLKSGKLSIKNMTKGRFNEIYQDYVCSCVLRVANELFSAIPDQLVIVTAVDDLLNSKTGHLEEAPILSVAISRRTLEAINLDAVDPSDSMNNFVHNMSFKKTQGFNRVDRVDPEGLNVT